MGAGVSLVPFKYVDRGDPAGYDFTVASFTIDTTWRDLNLSAIVPANAKAVHIIIRAKNTNSGVSVKLRTKGNSNALNVSAQWTQVAGLHIYIESIVYINPSNPQTIQYSILNSGTWNNIDTTIKGWFV